MYIHIYTYRKSASRFSRGTVLNTLKQSRINIMRGKKGRNYISRQACFMNRFTLQGLFLFVCLFFFYIYSALLQSIEHCSTRKSTCRLANLQTHIYILYTYIYIYFKRKKGRNYTFPTSLFRESLHSSGVLLSSATTALSTLSQGRLYPHIHLLYYYILVYTYGNFMKYRHA